VSIIVVCASVHVFHASRGSGTVDAGVTAQSEDLAQVVGGGGVLGGGMGGGGAVAADA